ncbi:hypothetical protein TrVGV298_002856 [Trichoderma virens]|nr:hypothetical protein TrVGV298_002856 [Trichoderma virens]
MPFTASDICKILLAIILPPIGVFLERGCGADLLINILLTILGYIPRHHPRSVHHIEILSRPSTTVSAGSNHDVAQHHAVRAKIITRLTGKSF